MHVLELKKNLHVIFFKQLECTNTLYRVFIIERNLSLRIFFFVKHFFLEKYWTSLFLVGFLFFSLNIQHYDVYMYIYNIVKDKPITVQRSQDHRLESLLVTTTTGVPAVTDEDKPLSHKAPLIQHGRLNLTRWLAFWHTATDLT